MEGVPHRLRLCVLGAGAVGKSSISVQLTQKQFLSNYDPTIEETFRTELELDGELVPLEILDTAGQEEYTSMRDTYYSAVDGFVMVYSITDDTSLGVVEDLRHRIFLILDMEERKDALPMVLAGNKSDLERERKILRSKGQLTADAWGVPFFETSAKTNANIYDLFVAALREVRRVRALAAAPRIEPNPVFDSLDGMASASEMKKQRRRTTVSNSHSNDHPDRSKNKSKGGCLLF